MLIGPQGLLWKYETGEFSDQQFYDAFCRATETRPDQAAFHKANSEIFTLNGSIVPVVGNLEEAGVPLGILSNTCASHWRVVADGRYGIIPGAFKQIVLSYEVKSLKPDPKIYQRAVELAGVPADKIFYIDDVPGHVEGALRRSRCRAIHHDRRPGAGTVEARRALQYLAAHAAHKAATAGRGPFSCDAKSDAAERVPLGNRANRSYTVHMNICSPLLNRQSKPPSTVRGRGQNSIHFVA